MNELLFYSYDEYFKFYFPDLWKKQQEKIGILNKDNIDNLIYKLREIKERKN